MEHGSNNSVIPIELAPQGTRPIMNSFLYKTSSVWQNWKPMDLMDLMRPKI